MNKSTAGSALFEGSFDKPIIGRFTDADASSDGGVALLAAAAKRTGLFGVIAGVAQGPRDPTRVIHSQERLLATRVLGLAAGYFDCSDSGDLRSDPMPRLGVGDRELDLPSQPTLSRFEHTPSAREVLTMGRRFESFVIDRLAQRYPDAKQITIDLDGTVDPAYGQQSFSSFNGYYGTNCLFPLLGFLTIDENSEQHLFAARLRPGTSREPRVSVALIRRTVASLNRAFPRANLVVRLDAGFAAPRLLDTLDELGVQYLVGFPENAVLKRMAAGHMVKAHKLACDMEGTCAVFGEGFYAARSWSSQRRVAFKAEVVMFPGRLPRDNARFVVTNMTSKPHKIWAKYALRGDSENRIKELKHELAVGLTSCTSYVANQFRVLMSSMAYFLFQELRLALAGTELEKSQVMTLRMKLMKVAVMVRESARRIVLDFPRSYPWQHLWRYAADRVGLIPA